MEFECLACGEVFEINLISGDDIQPEFCPYCAANLDVEDHQLKDEEE